jgi:molybdenum cofactor cytidylyltransferase
MKFGRIAVAQAEGAILAHSLRFDAGVFKKGRVLSVEDVAALTAAGVETVVAARLETGDVPEDAAAKRIADALAGPGTSAAAAFTGRCNLVAGAEGLLVVDPERVDALNLIDETVTVATLAPYERVMARQMLATVKIIPLAAPETSVAKAEAQGPLLRVAPFTAKKVGLVMSELPGTKASVLASTREVLEARLGRVKARLAAERICAHDETAIAAAIGEVLAEGAELVIVSGASAVVDRRDVVPAGIEAAGGSIDHFGMPVDPGNLLLLGKMTESGVPVVGMPGCARSPKLNGFDWVLERLAADLEITPQDIMRMGAGGLLKEIVSRPQPRAHEVAARKAPHVAALVLAAGQSRRMGARNKLLEEVDGSVMVRRAAENVLTSQAGPVVVVTGHEAERVRAALSDLDVVFAHNPDYAEGLSTSLRAGLGKLDAAVDGALVCLGDMPQVGAEQLDALIAAFDPVEGRSICVPVVGGKRGNPVLWGAEFFAQMGGVAGDVGARHLIGENAEVLCEVPADGDGVLLDIDTPEALAAFRKRQSA